MLGGACRFVTAVVAASAISALGKHIRGSPGEALDSELSGRCAYAEDGVCNCECCHGKIVAKDNPPQGSKGYQCKPLPEMEGQKKCTQAGNSTEWVVQTAHIITFERFCHYTCKAVIPEVIGSEVPCEHLSAEVIKRAQTPTGNGKSLVWRQNKMANSPDMQSVKAIKLD